MNRIKTAVFKNQRYQHNLSGENFAGLVRQATAKTVLAPDEAKNREIIRVIQDPESELPAAEISTVLRRRLRMENPHKQYLAVLLTRDVMMACARKIRTVYAELLYEIAVVAVQPSMPGTPAARKAKQAALEVLRGHEQAGNSAFKAASGLGLNSLQQQITRAQAAELRSSAGNTSNTGNAESVLSQLEKFGQIAKSHSDVFCDMLVSSEPGQLEETLIGELMREMQQMQEMLPKLIDKTSNMEGQRPEKALAEGMEALDAIEKAFKVHGDVKDGRAQESLKRQATQSLEPRGSFTFPKSEEDLLSGNPTESLIMGGGSSSSQPLPVQEADEDPFGLNALQEALDVAATSKEQGEDPFAMRPDPFASPGTPASPTPFQPGQAGGNPFSSQEQPPLPQYSQTPGYSHPQYSPQMMAPQHTQAANPQYAQQHAASPFASPSPSSAPNPFSQQTGAPFQQAPGGANPFAAQSNPFGQDSMFGPPPTQQQYTGGVQPVAPPVFPGVSSGNPSRPTTPPKGALGAHQQEQLQGFGSVNPFGPSTTSAPPKTQQAMGAPMGQPMGNPQGYGQPAVGGFGGQPNVFQQHQQQQQQQQQEQTGGQQKLDPEWDNFFADRVGR
ncbi:hypothetical protein BSKO_03727 [Bryopsis sp. KO-2023]|nr:hypothetical protein BSKO_03727 [Bryopsis sp. KO-2023]